PAGSVSVRLTPRASLGPLLVTVRVYVSRPPEGTDAGPRVVSTRSARVTVAVVTVPLLSAVFRSVAEEVTEKRLVRDEPLGVPLPTRARTVTVAVAPTATVPRLTVTTPFAWVALPWLGM